MYPACPQSVRKEEDRCLFQFPKKEYRFFTRMELGPYYPLVGFPETVVGNDELEPGPFPGLAVLCNQDIGDRKYLPGEEEPETGMGPVSPLEDLLL